MTSQMFPTEDMTFSEESKKLQRHLFHPFNVGIFMSGYKKSQGKVALGNNNALWMIIGKEQ
jgi:hypothetical protein